MGGVNLFNSQGNAWTADYLKITGERVPEYIGVADHEAHFARFTLNTRPFVCSNINGWAPSGPVNRLPCQPNRSSKPSIGWPVSTPLPRHDPIMVATSSGGSKSKKVSAVSVVVPLSS